jgi:6-phosphogluconolactonase
MPSVLYVSLQDENRIAMFAVAADGGGLTPRAGTPVAGGPSALAFAPDRRVLYVGHRDPPAISAFRIDRGDGALAPLGTVATSHAPTYLAPDRSGRHLLSAYYQGGFAAVHPLSVDGTLAAPESDRQATANGAHAIQTDPSNRFAFVPHIARLNDNVLEPPRDNPGPNMILQFRFDAASGRLAANTPFRVEPAERLGPRHYCFHPTLPLAYFSNEQGSSVSCYRLDPAAGTLAAVETVSTLPDGFAGRNTCSQIHLTPAGRFLYVGNRGHNSIAGFAVDAQGHLAAIGRVATEPVPSAFGLDPAGDFLYAAGSASGRLAAYRIDRQSGILTPLATYDAGRRPMAVLAIRLGD